MIFLYVQNYTSIPKHEALDILKNNLHMVNSSVQIQ